MSNFCSALARMPHRVLRAREERVGSWTRQTPKGGDVVAGPGSPTTERGDEGDEGEEGAVDEGDDGVWRTKSRVAGKEASEARLPQRALVRRVGAEARRETVWTSCLRAVTGANLGCCCCEEMEKAEEDEDGAAAVASCRGEAAAAAAKGGRMEGSW